MLDDLYLDGNTAMAVAPFAVLVVDDFEMMLEKCTAQGDSFHLNWIYGFNIDGDLFEERTLSDSIRFTLWDFMNQENNCIASCRVESREVYRTDFFDTFGSLFFLGIMLSVLFLLAAVLIIYYKQLTEGYEDQRSFAIMQKVGITKKEIQNNINSQILTVFLLPLVFAVLHLTFAFPMIWKMLQLFDLRNLNLMISVTVVCVAAFSVFYALTYKITSGTYYNIVSNIK